MHPTLIRLTVSATEFHTHTHTPLVSGAVAAATAVVADPPADGGGVICKKTTVIPGSLLHRCHDIPVRPLFLQPARTTNTCLPALRQAASAHMPTTHDRRNGVEPDRTSFSPFSSLCSRSRSERRYARTFRRSYEGAASLEEKKN
eukprot:GHVU01053833.1.p2 GENE.GHVU01053833.1~~GHVU01053833.1.p2  ORF type:complete len:145 (+),score=9.41 GHVU01053833.1:362-796(+)